MGRDSSKMLDRFADGRKASRPGGPGVVGPSFPVFKACAGVCHSMRLRARVLVRCSECVTRSMRASLTRWRCAMSALAASRVDARRDDEDGVAPTGASFARSSLSHLIETGNDRT